MSASQVIHLQGIGGNLQAIAAEEIKIGMRTCWNFSYTYDVVSIEPKGAQSLHFGLRSTKDGHVWYKTMRKSRAVVAYWPRVTTAGQ